MEYCFDKVIDRRGTDALKIDEVPALWGRDDLLPLWVADMDFETPHFVMDALKERLEHPILGYTGRAKAWYEAIRNWQRVRYGWEVKKEWLNFVPGIVPGLAFAVQCFTEPGDKILVQTPVYHPYLLVPSKNGRVVVEAELKMPPADGKVHGAEEMVVDWDDFEAKATGCKLFFLCHPHNPGGRVWRKEELVRMAEICQRKGVVVVSDEIHADLTLAGYQHFPFASVCEAAAQNSITFASPSKAFNMAGLTSSYAIVPNEKIREKFSAYMENNELNMGHLFAFIAVAAAYSHGTEWLDACLKYIQENIDFVEDFVQRELPDMAMIRPEASFLVFLDCRKMGLSVEALHELFTDKAHLALNDGAMFGKGGEGFMRLNVATPRSVLEKALSQLKEALFEVRG